jgi:hypothetical protein
MKIRNLLVSSAALALAAGTASANLVVDLVPQSGTEPLILNPGDTFSLNIVATIDSSATGTGLQSAQGRIRTSGLAIANVTSALTSAPFNGANHQDTDGPAFATLVDLDADTDIDVGSNNNGSSAGFFAFRSDAITLGNSFTVGTVTFSVPLNAVPGSTGTAVWERRVAGTTGSGSAVWREGTSVFSGSTTAAELYLNGDGVTYEIAAVPEPTSLALAGMTGLGLLARRRRIAR